MDEDALTESTCRCPRREHSPHSTSQATNTMFLGHREEAHTTGPSQLRREPTPTHHCVREKEDLWEGDGQLTFLSAW